MYVAGYAQPTLMIPVNPLAGVIESVVVALEPRAMDSVVGLAVTVKNGETTANGRVALVGRTEVAGCERTRDVVRAERQRINR